MTRLIQSPSIHLGISLALALSACGDDDETGSVPVCDDIDWPLDVEPNVVPPPPEFTVECVRGWGNVVETRPALETIALPNDTWSSKPHPDGGWMFVVAPEYQPGWNQWLEEKGHAAATLPGQVLLRYPENGDLGWIVPQFYIWTIEIVANELWALGWDQDRVPWILAFDPASGELLDASPWDVEPRFNRLAAAPDPAGGVWITGIGNRQEDGRVVQTLYRATTIEALQLVATRTTEYTPYAPSGGILGLEDGAVAWRTWNGFEVVEPDGSVRWAHANGAAGASNADSMLIVSRISTLGDGQALRLEKVALFDGSPIWTRIHQRFEVADVGCGDDCSLVDSAYPVLRPDGGYMLVGRHAYPSSTCPGQPLLMAVSADGDAEWAHRVDVCGVAYDVAFRDGARLEVLGATADANKWVGGWRRWFEL